MCEVHSFQEWNHPASTDWFGWQASDSGAHLTVSGEYGIHQPGGGRSHGTVRVSIRTRHRWYKRWSGWLSKCFFFMFTYFFNLSVLAALCGTDSIPGYRSATCVMSKVKSQARLGLWQLAVVLSWDQLVGPNFPYHFWYLWVKLTTKIVHCKL